MGIMVLIAAVVALSGCAPTRVMEKKSWSSEEQVQSKIDLGSAMLLQGENTRALAELLEAKKMKGETTATIENFLGLAYYGLKEYDLALARYQESLKLDPTRTDVRNNLGLVYLATGNYEKALAEFQTCTKDLVYQKKHLPLTNLGQTYIAMGDYDKALTVLKKVTSITPNYAKSYHHIGRIYLIKGQLSEARDYFTNAIRLNPDDPEPYMFLGDIQVKLNSPEEAAASYSRITTLVPSTPMALEAQKRARAAMGF